VLDALRRVRGELDTAGLRVALDERIEARLMDRDFAPVQPIDLARVDSTQMTWLPGSARQAPITRPTYPEPKVVTRMVRS
jgi:hypothetical protein